jgi:hypothetical protein
VVQQPRTARERALKLLRTTLAIRSWLPTTKVQRPGWAIRGSVVLGLLVLIASAFNKTLWDWLALARRGRGCSGSLTNALRLIKI